MIGHYLLTLNAAAEDRVLTTTFGPVVDRILFEPAPCWGCLCMTASGDENDKTGVNYPEEIQRGATSATGWRSPGWVYEYACVRFGTERVNAAIRNRILSNRARRVLQSVEAAHV